MSYSRLLHRKVTGEKRIEDVFNRFVLDRGVKVSIDDKKESIAKAVQELYKVAITKGRTDDDEFFATFLTLWNTVFTEHERGRPYAIYPSQLRNECARKLYYEVTREEYSDEVADTLTARQQMIFDFGTLIHIYIQAVLWFSGILLKSEIRFKDPERFVRGRTDGVIFWENEEMVLEIKSKNSFQFKKVLLGPTEDEQYQASMYAHYLGKKKTAFFYFNKDTQEIKVHIVTATEKYLKGFMTKLDHIRRSVDEEEIPSRDCKTLREGRDCNCPFATLCFKQRR